MASPLLSVNVNKYALLRNSRGQNAPDLLASSDLCVAAGAHGITVHPRMDQRHVRFDDLEPLARHLEANHPGIELNIECEPHPSIITRVLAIRPAQCTLVPVSPGELTSDHGWSLPAEQNRLAHVVETLDNAGIRVSLFADCDAERIPYFARTGAHRVELYTGPYAEAWGTDRQDAETARVFDSARAAGRAGLQVNAGHDLDRFNLAGLAGLPGLCEVSIGHAQICRALEVGTPQSVQELLAALGW